MSKNKKSVKNKNDCTLKAYMDVLALIGIKDQAVIKNGKIASRSLLDYHLNHYTGTEANKKIAISIYRGLKQVQKDLENALKSFELDFKIKK